MNQESQQYKDKLQELTELADKLNQRSSESDGRVTKLHENLNQL